MRLRVAVDTIVFGPLIILRYKLAGTADAFRCTECTGAVKDGELYGLLNDGIVCDPCADRLEAEHS
ncbi:hypothetical protein [Streptomyces sp. NPDC005244]|uniref:hypothetical protein n=1 Tax=Streptomyces sp. NPDC005244 TaxID=3364708 RepID=UPI0036CDBE96